MSGGAGFLPSTVLLPFISQQKPSSICQGTSRHDFDLPVHTIHQRLSRTRHDAQS